jgi:hypothetical protein
MSLPLGGVRLPTRSPLLRNMFYIGSCRYMYDYDWDFFPARLHTTKEIIFFLENVNNIEHIINQNPSDITNLIFGDIYHPCVINDTRRFLARGINKNASKIILEICSRKIMYYNNIPINYYYSSKANKRYNLEKVILTDEEVDLDLEYIIKLCKTVFNENIQVHIIPHLNLKTKLNNDYIYERHGFVYLLESLCKKHNIKIHNVGKFIENNNHECFLEDYMSDSTHYSKDYDKVKAFLVSEIMENP